MPGSINLFLPPRIRDDIEGVGHTPHHSGTHIVGHPFGIVEARLL